MTSVYTQFPRTIIHTRHTVSTSRGNNIKMLDLTHSLLKFHKTFFVVACISLTFTHQINLDNNEKQIKIETKLWPHIQSLQNCVYVNMYKRKKLELLQRRPTIQKRYVHCAVCAHISPIRTTTAAATTTTKCCILWKQVNTIRSNTLKGKLSRNSRLRSVHTQYFARKFKYWMLVACV